MPSWIALLLIGIAALVPAGLVVYVDVPNYLNHVQVVGTMPVQAAPGPIVGAGIPALLIAGGLYAYRWFAGKRN